MYAETSFYKGSTGSGMFTVKPIRYMFLTLGQAVRHVEWIQEEDVCAGIKDGVMGLILLFDIERW
jgi:hypothetical protein